MRRLNLFVFLLFVDEGDIELWENDWRDLPREEQRALYLAGELDEEELAELVAADLDLAEEEWRDPERVHEAVYAWLDGYDQDEVSDIGEEQDVEWTVVDQMAEELALAW